MPLFQTIYVKLSVKLCHPNSVCSRIYFEVFFSSILADYCSYKFGMSTTGWQGRTESGTVTSVHIQFLNCLRSSSWRKISSSCFACCLRIMFSFITRMSGDPLILFRLWHSLSGQHQNERAFSGEMMILSCVIKESLMRRNTLKKKSTISSRREAT